MPNNPFEPMIKNIGDYVSGTLYAQGVIPPIGIDNYEGLALASPADVHLLAAKDPVIDEIAVGMTGNLISGKTVSGVPPLQLSDSAGYPLQSWSVNVSPYQEGTGDPSPDNVRPIHGTDTLNILTAVNGDNQYNKDTVVPNVYLDVDGVEQGSQSWTVSEYISVCGGATYTISGYYIAGNAPHCCWYDFNKTFIGSFHLVDPMGASGTSTITAPSNASYLRMSIQPHYADTTKLEFGSLRTEYTPYLAPSQTVITLPQTVYTGTIGSEGGESRWGEVDLGTLNWRFTNNRAITDDLNGIIKPPTSTSVVSGSIAEQYTEIQATGTLADSNYAILYLSNTWQIFFYYDGVNLPTGKLVFPLLTPKTFPLTAPTIPTPIGTATTWATAEDGTVDSMEVEYIEND